MNECDGCENMKLKNAGVTAIVGPSQSGKSLLIHHVVTNADILFETPPTLIMIVHADGCGQQFQELANADPRVCLSEGLPVDGFQSLKSATAPTICIFDDVTPDRELLHRIACVWAHHLSCHFILTLHSLYTQHNRILRLNCTYMCLLSYPADRSFVQKYASQFRPGQTKFFTDCYVDATTMRPYGYLFLDLAQKTAENRRILCNCLGENGLTTYAYEPARDI